MKNLIVSLGVLAVMIDYCFSKLLENYKRRSYSNILPILSTQSNPIVLSIAGTSNEFLGPFPNLREE